MAFDIDNPIGTGTDQELLDFTRAAIAQVTMHGQAYSTGFGRNFTRADLPDLHKQEDRLIARIAGSVPASSSGGKANYASFGRAV